jgi:uncharacterized delta-60 repeat protein
MRTVATACSAISILVLALSAPSQSVTEIERVFGGTGPDRGVFVAPTSDGGFVAVGVTRSFGAGEEDVYLVRTDPDGELLWSSTYGGPARDNGWSVHEIPDGFIIAGFTESFGNGGFDFYLVKTDSSGEMVWSQTYGGPGDDRAWALLPKDDGGYVLAGETTSFGAGEADCWLVETDPLGNEVRSKVYGGSGGDRCFSIVASPDGGYLLAGQTYSEGAGDRDAYVIKTDSAGGLEWSRTFGGPESDVGHYVAPTSDGNFVVTGYTTSFAEGADDPYLVKIATQGETIWERVITLEGINHTLTGEQTPDGGFCLVGFSDSPETRARAALLVKANSSGHLEWSRDILRTDHGESFGYTVRALPDGRCVFTGHTTVGSAGDTDLLLVRYGRETRR